jgi:hypothetical protein
MAFMQHSGVLRSAELADSFTSSQKRKRSMKSFEIQHFYIWNIDVTEANWKCNTAVSMVVETIKLNIRQYQFHHFIFRKEPP